MPLIFSHAYNCLKCVPLMSGALSLFNRQAVIDIGGYSDDTLGEDFDLTLKLHEYSKNSSGRIIYTEKAIAYTQVPFDLRSFYRQRLRWQIGFLQVLKKYITLLIRTSLLSLVLNLMNFYESLSILLILVLMISLRIIIVFSLALKGVPRETLRIPIRRTFYFSILNKQIAKIAALKLLDTFIDLSTINRLSFCFIIKFIIFFCIFIFI